MRTELFVASWIVIMTCAVFAGRPIFLTESQACSEADLVIIGTVETPEDLPDADPFTEPKWGERFTRIAKISNSKVLLGAAQGKLFICGGKAAGGPDYRIEAGDYLLLLRKVGDGFYRAVDWNHSFMRAKNGKIEWLVDKASKKTEWIATEEALLRINKNRKEAKQAGAD